MTIYHQNDLTIRTVIYVMKDSDNDNRYGVGYEHIDDETGEPIHSVAYAQTCYNPYMALEHAAAIRADAYQPQPSRTMLIVAYQPDGTHHETIDVDIFEHSMDELAKIMDNMIEATLNVKPRLALVQ